MHGFPVAVGDIGNVMFLGQGLNTLVNSRMSELRHGGEQVVLNLVVQVAHPPVTEEGWSDVRSMNKGVLDPMCRFRRDGQVGMGEGKVSEQIDRHEPGGEEPWQESNLVGEYVVAQH